MTYKTYPLIPIHTGSAEKSCESSSFCCCCGLPAQSFKLIDLVLKINRMLASILLRAGKKWPYVRSMKRNYWNVFNGRGNQKNVDSFELITNSRRQLWFVFFYTILVLCSDQFWNDNPLIPLWGHTQNIKTFSTFTNRFKKNLRCFLKATTKKKFHLSWLSVIEVFCIDWIAFMYVSGVFYWTVLRKEESYELNVLSILICGVWTKFGFYFAKRQFCQ